MTMLTGTLRRSCGALTCVISVLTLGCGLLDVAEDPGATTEEDLANREGALAQRNIAMAWLWRGQGDGALFGGILSDELIEIPQPGYFIVAAGLSQRDGPTLVAGDAAVSVFMEWATARFDGSRAILRLRAFVSDAPALVGEMFAVRGFATLSMAEQFCPGFALNEVVDNRPVFGPALTTDAVFQAAVAELDSAIVLGQDSTEILNFALVAQGRALLGLGRFAEASAAAAQVPTAFLKNAEFAPDVGGYYNSIALNVLDFGFGPAVGIADVKGGNGLDYVTAADPRVVATPNGSATVSDTIPMYAPGKYPSFDSPIVMASGIEARLIEAEAALHAGNANWLTILNSLRATEVTPSLPPLGDPGTPAAQVDLLFRERAFWLYGTGHRLGDLRRLVAQYGRGPETVFPTGTFEFGGVYGTATSLPFPQLNEPAANPNVTVCTGGL